MEFATFSLLKDKHVDEDELMRCLYPENVSDIDLVRIAFDAAKLGSGKMTVYHRRAINELMDRFVYRKMNTSTWEAAEALRELMDSAPQGMGENAKEALSSIKEGELELESISRLMTIATIGGGQEKVANAIRCLADHYVRGRFQYDDEEYFSLLLYRSLRDEKNERVLIEVASALELLGERETLEKIQHALRNRGWEEFPGVRRKLISIERKLCGRFGENPIEIMSELPSRRRGSAPPSSEKTFVAVKRVGRA